jgi:hypothetical protein
MPNGSRPSLKYQTQIVRYRSLAATPVGDNRGSFRG